jgi:predicted transcriptional regulator
MIKEEIETLRDLEQEIIAAIMADLETGSHFRNNEASKVFSKTYPSLIKAIGALGAWIDKQEELT